MDVREELVELLDGMFNGECCVDKTEAADFLIANGVTVQEWISVKDRLPNDNGSLQAFLVCRNQRSVTSGKVLIQTEFFTNTFSGRDNVTHWMPLPQPPVDMSRMFENVSADDLRAYREKT